MTTNIEQYRQMDFDEEYGIYKLLPFSVLEDLCNQLQQISSASVLVLRSDGACYFCAGALSSEDKDSVCLLVRQHDIESSKVLRMENGGTSVIIPLTHELDTIGYLVFYYVKDKEASLSFIIPLGECISKVLNRIIYYNYKYLMASNLHGQVIEESYAQLKRKADLLEESERKYRILAENLEIEVEKKAEKIKKTQDQLMQQEKMASIGQLAAGVAHEINNPTGFVSSNLETLTEYNNDISVLLEEYRKLISELKENPANVDLQSYIGEQIERISALETEADMDFIMNDITDLIRESKDGTERIKKIVIDLKDFAHPGEDKKQSADINQGIESTLNVVWNELRYKVTVKKDYGKLPLVNCYPQQLNQVFMNILVNAAQAIEEKGEIRIVTRALDGNVEILISDTGSGIPEENLSKIFDPFFTTKPVGSGTGLGMNVAYNIIKKHKGSIDVKSTRGKGSTFRIMIPADNWNRKLGT